MLRPRLLLLEPRPRDAVDDERFEMLNLCFWPCLKRTALMSLDSASGVKGVEKAAAGGLLLGWLGWLALLTLLMLDDDAWRGLPSGSK